MAAHCNWKTKMPIVILSLPIVCLAGCLAMVYGVAAENTPAGTSNLVSKPGDLLKETDGMELRFGYFP